MDVSLWSRSFTAEHSPAYQCPHCRKGTLSIKKGTLIKDETVNSRRQQQADYWDPMMVSYVFTCWLVCGASRCGGSVAVAGTGRLEMEWDEEQGEQWIDCFQPETMIPMPEVFNVPDSWPDDLTHELRASFRLIWSDRAGAAARLRTAVERLLDHLGVPRRVRGKRGYSRPTLHQRLDTLGEKHQTPAENLRAIKWFGNTGTHESEVSMSDLLSAYEIMEHEIEVLVEQRAKKVAVLARKLRKGHQPRRRQRR